MKTVCRNTMKAHMNPFKCRKLYIIKRQEEFQSNNTTKNEH